MLYLGRHNLPLYVATLIRFVSAPNWYRAGQLRSARLLVFSCAVVLPAFAGRGINVDGLGQGSEIAYPRKRAVAITS